MSKSVGDTNTKGVRDLNILNHNLFWWSVTSAVVMNMNMKMKYAFVDHVHDTTNMKTIESMHDTGFFLIQYEKALFLR